MSTKLVVTNWTALTGKYGSAGVKQIKQALAALQAADAERGLKTVVVGLDRLAKKKVTDPTDPEENKAAVDAAFQAAKRPDYLMLLGATDVIPHQDLANPVPRNNGDADPVAYSDLPYACEAPYSREIADFKGPTRVVGRLPDVIGADEPSFLLGLLGTATRHKTRPAAEYEGFLGLTAKEWQPSTKMSLRNVFGTSKGVRVSPDDGPMWTAAELAPLAHFVNCHGGQGDHQFYGQDGESYPVAHESLNLVGKVREGTVAAFECCYGAELYAEAVNPSAGIASAYLAGGAYGVVGSTTIAFGPPSGNGEADLICQYFLRKVVDGASLGRAMLEARIDYVQMVPLLSPVDLKTLAQFLLLGDPSIHPVAAESSVKTFATAKSLQGLANGALRLISDRTARRDSLSKLGAAIGAVSPATGKAVAFAASKNVRALLDDALAKYGAAGGATTFASFPVKAAKTLGTLSFKKMGGEVPSRVHVAVKRLGTDGDGGPPSRLVAIIATEEQGRVVLRETFGK